MNREVEKMIAQLPGMHPHHIARLAPDRPAVIMAGLGLPAGAEPEIVTYRQLDQRSNQLAHLFRSLGLRRGDTIALFMSNCARYHETAWAAQRSGLRFVCCSSKLAAGELEYIVRDSGAKVVVATPDLKPVARQLAARMHFVSSIEFFMVLDPEPEFPFRSLESARDRFPVTPLSDQSAGQPMPYSSGTTGRPKGIIRHSAQPSQPFDAVNPMAVTGLTHFGFKPLESVYVSPGPLYHSSPIGWTMAIHAIGGTVVVLEKFDAEAVLRLIEKYQCTTGHFVATHFVRMLKLPQQIREKYSTKSLVRIFHSAAPTPVEVKKRMIEWFGPIIQEFYGGSEGIGMCFVTCEEWLRRPGTCGRPYPSTLKVHIWDEERDVEIKEPRKEGVVYFEGGGKFEYNNDPVKTAEAMNKLGFATLGDIGYLDEEGYLFLTDRKAFMIISGGVNIYPQEIEATLITHPLVADVAVVGAPDPEMGERVVAVVQPLDWTNAGAKLSEELKSWLRERISHVKVPREISFSKELPRHDTGKIYKRFLKDAYHGKADPSYKGVIPGDASSRL